MDVINDIIKINELLASYFNSDIYDMFLDGYCLEYADILHMKYPESKMVIHKEKDHVGVLINGNIYDVSGIRNKDEFTYLSEIEEGYVRSFYKKFSSYDKINIYNLLNEKEKNVVKSINNLI